MNVNGLKTYILVALWGAATFALDYASGELDLATVQEMAKAAAVGALRHGVAKVQTIEAVLVGGPTPEEPPIAVDAEAKEAVGFQA